MFICLCSGRNLEHAKYRYILKQIYCRFGSMLQLDKRVLLSSHHPSDLIINYLQLCCSFLKGLLNGLLHLLPTPTSWNWVLLLIVNPGYLILNCGHMAVRFLSGWGKGRGLGAWTWLLARRLSAIPRKLRLSYQQWLGVVLKV